MTTSNEFDGTGTDALVAGSVKHALEQAVGVETHQLFVHVSLGIVTLSGMVGSRGERISAKNAAMGVDGVTTVIDSILVPDTPRLSDAAIAQGLDRVLTQSRFVPTGSVQAEIRDQVVTLTGTVAHTGERRTIQEMIGAIPRVGFVDNRITVVSDRF